MRRSDRSDRKIEKQSFLWCCSINAGGEIIAYYEGGKGIRRVVIKIHTLRIVCLIPDLLHIVLTFKIHNGK